MFRLVMRYVFGDYELDTQLYQLRSTDELVEIEPKVFDLLVYLIHHYDRVVSKDELLDKLWPGQVVSETALTQCVMTARKAVGDDGTRQQTIKTQHGRGYRFVGKVVSRQPSVARREEEVDRRRQTQSVTEQEISSVMPVQAGIQESQAEASGQSPWIPAFAGMTPPSSEPQNHHPASQPHQSSDVSALPVQRSWSVRSLLVMGLVLLVGVILTVQYLSRPTLSTQSSELGTAQAPLALPDKPSIIILPFVNLSGDPSQEYFSDGMTEEITSALSRLSSFFVIARTSAFTYKGKAAKVQDISREMGVRYVLEGSVQKAEGDVRIIAQLIDATNGKHLWSESYERPLTDIFAVHDEIRQKIVLALKVKLTPEEQERFQRAPTNNLEAYDYWLRGHDLSLHSLPRLCPIRQHNTPYP